MLDSLIPQPASIQGNFDIVAWNDGFCRLMGVDFAALPQKTVTVFISISPTDTAQPLFENRDVLPTFVSYFARPRPNTGRPAVGK